MDVRDEGRAPARWGRARGSRRAAFGALAAIAVASGLVPASGQHRCDGRLVEPIEIQAGPLTVRAPSGAPSYEYCGVHPDLPLAFWVNTSNLPSGLASDAWMSAVVDAMEEWNRHWPTHTAPEAQTADRARDRDCPVFCLGGTTSRRGNRRDGVSTISWSSEFGCGSHTGHPAVACLHGDGDHGIAEVDIVLDPKRAWLQPGPFQNPEALAIGELDPNITEFLGIRPTWFDVQSIVTHELGHAVGLEDIGDLERPWWGTGADAHRAHQTMYRWYYPGTTNKRTLADGDIAGLLRVWLDETVLVAGQVPG